MKITETPFTIFRNWKIVYLVDKEDRPKVEAFVQSTNFNSETGISLGHAIMCAREIYGTPVIVNIKTGEIKLIT
jgi:hypothetical protein